MGRSKIHNLDVDAFFYSYPHKNLIFILNLKKIR